MFLYCGEPAQKNGGRHRDLRLKGKHPIHCTIVVGTCINMTLIPHTLQDLRTPKNLTQRAGNTGDLILRLLAKTVKLGT